jgi:hypothetical protein
VPQHLRAARILHRQRQFLHREFLHREFLDRELARA